MLVNSNRRETRLLCVMSIFKLLLLLLSLSDSAVCLGC